MRHRTRLEQDTLISEDFDDVFYSRDSGLEETRYVFLLGNHLPSRWLETEFTTEFKIAELGFGTGLNFAVTAAEWLRTAAPHAQLVYRSCEKYPLDSEILEQALMSWSELRPQTQEIVKVWKQFQDQAQSTPLQSAELFEKRVKLEIYFGDALEWLRSYKFNADAWYLDGFSPKKNPDLWSPELIQEVFRHTASEGTFGTYTAAGDVRRALIQVGFTVEKVPGFGNKRECLRGRVADRARSAD